MDLVKAQAQEWAIKLLTELNADNDNNYPYTQKQFEALTDNVEDLLTRGIRFNDDLVERIVCEGYNGQPFSDLSDLLDDIFDGNDENGVPFTDAQRDDANRNPFHFNATPYAIGAKRPW